MKKIFSILFILMLSACASPQVTVTSEATVTLPAPTETLIPTPTLHPQFIEVQNLIADSGERFTLLLDGTIEETTSDSTKQIIPNLHVDQNGIINIIFNNENVAIDSSQVTFDDENGLIIDGYELENDEWVEVVPILTPEALWQQDLAEWQLDSENYRVTQDVEGNTVVVKKSTQEIVKINDKWNLDVMRQMIATTEVEGLSCLETRWVGTKGQSIGPKIDGDSWFKIISVPQAEKVKKELLRLGIFSDYPIGFIDFLGGSNNCWATTQIQKMFQSPDVLAETYIFWQNEKKELLYKKVFGPRAVKVELVEN